MLVPVIFLKPSLGILFENSLGAPQDAVKRTFFVPEELLMMSFCILEAAWRKSVQELVLFPKMFWGGNCAIWAGHKLLEEFSFSVFRTTVVCLVLRLLPKPVSHLEA